MWRKCNHVGELPNEDEAKEKERKEKKKDFDVRNSSSHALNESSRAAAVYHFFFVKMK